MFQIKISSIINIFEANIEYITFSLIFTHDITAHACVFWCAMEMYFSALLQSSNNLDQQVLKVDDVQQLTK